MTDEQTVLTDKIYYVLDIQYGPTRNCTRKIYVLCLYSLNNEVKKKKK